MQHCLTFLFGAATASCWWAASIWTTDNAQGGFICAGTLLSLLALAIALKISVDETGK